MRLALLSSSSTSPAESLRRAASVLSSFALDELSFWNWKHLWSQNKAQIESASSIVVNYRWRIAIHQTTELAPDARSDQNWDQKGGNHEDQSRLCRLHKSERYITHYVTWYVSCKTHYRVMWELEQNEWKDMNLIAKRRRRHDWVCLTWSTRIEKHEQLWTRGWWRHPCRECWMTC